MSLSSRTINKLIDTINTTFTSLGHANGMRMPKSTDNREPAAWELFVARHVLRLAEKRKDAAETAAVMAGVIPDKDKSPLPPGTRQIYFRGEVVDVQVEVRNASERVNVDVMIQHLITVGGVKPEVVEKAKIAATKTTKPAHVFTPMLAANE